MKRIEDVVQRQLDFYNNHDLEGFASIFHENIEILNFVDKSVILKGKLQLLEKYRTRFEIQKVHAKLVNRMVIGNKVIDHEEVSGIKEDELVNAVAIYEVNEELITKVWFLFE